MEYGTLFDPTPNLDKGGGPWWCRGAQSFGAQLTDAVICPRLIGPKGLTRRSKPGAVSDAANAGSDKVFVRDAGHGISAP